MPFAYNFPPHKDAQTLPQYPRQTQMCKILEEVVELNEALLNYDKGMCNIIPVAMEAMDVIHATETLLRQIEKSIDFRLFTMDEAYDKVIKKNKERGYYADLVRADNGREKEQEPTDDC
jgi:NTP pyrophosphatase (non-canonical NTP hydrolase)